MPLATTFRPVGATQESLCRLLHDLGFGDDDGDDEEEDDIFVDECRDDLVDDLCDGNEGF